MNSIVQLPDDVTVELVRGTAGQFLGVVLHGLLSSSDFARFAETQIPLFEHVRIVRNARETLGGRHGTPTTGWRKLGIWPRGCRPVSVRVSKIGE